MSGEHDDETVRHQGAVVGTGRVGRAIAEGCQIPAGRHYSGRELLAKRELTFPPEVTTLIHAAGPAGESSCREDPGLAFTLHYTLTERLVGWLNESSQRQLILLGTVAPNTGFYGPLKRASIQHAWQCRESGETEGTLSIIECGHVIGYGLPVSDANAGVVARFVKAAVQGQRLQMTGGGLQTLAYTPLPDLLQLVKQLTVKPRLEPILSLVSPPVNVLDVGRMCLRLAKILYNVDRGILVDTYRTTQLSYDEPTGVVLPVQDLSDVLIQWMRTTEVKMLLGVR